MGKARVTCEAQIKKSSENTGTRIQISFFVILKTIKNLNINDSVKRSDVTGNLFEWLLGEKMLSWFSHTSLY